MPAPESAPKDDSQACRSRHAAATRMRRAKTTAASTVPRRRTSRRRRPQAARRRRRDAARGRRADEGRQPAGRSRPPTARSRASPARTRAARSRRSVGELDRPGARPRLPAAAVEVRLRQGPGRQAAAHVARRRRQVRGRATTRTSRSNQVLQKLMDIDLYYRARTNFGTVDMSNYTVQADAKVNEKIAGERRYVPERGGDQQPVRARAGRHAQRCRSTSGRAPCRTSATRTGRSSDDRVPVRGEEVVPAEAPGDAGGRQGRRPRQGVAGRRRRSRRTGC